jgi:hypothetical protein
LGFAGACKTAPRQRAWDKDAPRVPRLEWITLYARRVRTTKKLDLILCLLQRLVVAAFDRRALRSQPE